MKEIICTKSQSASAIAIYENLIYKFNFTNDSEVLYMRKIRTYKGLFIVNLENRIIKVGDHNHLSDQSAVTSLLIVNNLNENARYIQR